MTGAVTIPIHVSLRMPGEPNAGSEPRASPTPASGAPDVELTARLLSAISDEYARLVLADPDEFPPERLLSHARWVLEQAELR